MALAPGTRLGPYEILAPVGSGGMGEVYRARDSRLDRLVAIKVLPTDTISPLAFERFEREAKAIAALNHPGICAIHDVGTTPVPFLVMELLDGETLHDRIQRGPIDVPALVEIGLALADALATAHARGIIHRDLKPANLFVTAHGPKIVDFGLARATEAAAAAGVTANPTRPVQPPLTDAGVAVGTTAYMSPEQLRGEIPDARSDLFSLGLVLYEMATGRRAFGRATNAVTSAAILHEQPVAPRQLRPEVPARLEQTILTLLEKDRDIRTQTASELRADLTRLKRELLGARAPDAPPLGGAVGDNGPAPTAASASPSSSSDAQVIAGVIRRHRSAAVLAAALLLLTVVAIGYFTRSHTSATPSADGVSGLSVADLQVEQLTTSGTADAPAISPDGNYVVYIERGAGLDSLRVRQVATESSVPIVPSEPGTVLRGATVTPDGAFVNFVRQVGAQPFELWQVPLLGGTARRLFPGGRVGFSPKGDQMAHVRTASAGRTELVVTSSDGSGERILASRQLPKRFWPAGATNSFAPAWAADGATIAVLGADGDAGQVVLVDVKTGSEQAVASGSALAGTGLEWLTNDTLLVSMVDRPSAMLQLWLVSRGGGAHRRLTNDTNEYFGVSVTADRNAVVTARGEYSFDIWTTDAAVIKWSQAIPTKRSKGPPFSPLHWIGDDLLFISSSTNSLTLSRWHTSTRYEEVLAKSAGRPSVSRDGSTILFLDYDSNELWSMNQVTQTRDRIRGRVGLRDTARLTPDGHHYVTIDTPAGSAPAIVLAALDGTNSPRTITTDRVRVGASLLDLGRVEVSRDGQWVAYSSVSEGGQPLIAVCDLAACSSRREFAGLGGRWQWAPDSLALAYVDPKTQSDLWVQPLDASAPRRLAQFEPDGHEIWSFEWSADARRLAVSRGKASRDIVLVRGLGGKK